MPGWFQIWTEIEAPDYMSNKAYKKQIEKKLENPDSTKNPITVAEMQYYIFDSKQLRWMNCDQFINPNPITTNFAVKVPKSKNIFAKVIFKNYKTVMIGDESPEYFTFNNLPINEPVTVVVIDEQDGQVFYKIEDTKTTEEVFEVKNLKKGNLQEVKKALEYLD